MSHPLKLFSAIIGIGKFYQMILNFHINECGVVGIEMSPISKIAIVNHLASGLVQGYTEINSMSKR